MKKIVTVKRHIDGRNRIYEVPEGMDLAVDTYVIVEYRDGTTAATTTQPTIEVEDDIIQYFTPRALRRVVATISMTKLDWGEDAEAEE